ncbi:MAG: DNA gyrase subunit A [Nitrospinota bacterium]|nr:MAG: DNA gyrase subunit A [Nitrospinota bacterium]
MAVLEHEVPREVPVNIEEEVKSAFLDYAMSVIISRALPDVRDGLKPVHRRILVTMHDLRLTHNRPYRKCAKIAGDVSGNYHPHGEAVVYPSLVRMAQPFSLRYPLVDGQGNFGSIDGDPPAAMRYTEARMTRIAEEMLRDIEEETVDFVPNYDGTREEPVVLPSRIPNLLINGSSGIAVGMATNIPPHNLREVIDALVMLLDHPDMSVDDLLLLIPGPDFPTAGFIYGEKGIRDAYATGRGLIQLRARALFEEAKRGERERIVIVELPYQVNKARLVEEIAELVRDRVIEGIADLRDESDRNGMRIVIELKRNENAQVILNQLYKHTHMQVTFGIIMLALVNNQPRILTLKELLTHFLNHRKEVIVRRTRFRLRKAQERLHVLQGLKTALEHIDRVLTILRRAPSPQEARETLVSTLSLSPTQAQAILDMRLQRLTGLEREKILQDYQEVETQIQTLQGILSSEEQIKALIKEELLEIREEYGDERLTDIVPEMQEIEPEDLIPEEEVVVAITHSGYIKRSPVRLYRSQHRGGKGSRAIRTRAEDVVEHLFVTSTHFYLLFFSNVGKVHWLKVHEIPEGGGNARGKAIVNLLQLEPGEKITACIPVKGFEEEAFLVMATQQGIVKKTPLNAYANLRRGGIRAINLDNGDQLIAVRMTNGKQNLLLSTVQGKAVQFPESDVRPVGRTARGVIGIRLEPGDQVIGMEVVEPGVNILTVTENGYGKQTPLTEYPCQARGGKGVINIKTTPRNGTVVGVKSVCEADELMLITSSGNLIRLQVREIPVIGRNTQGVRLIRLEEEDKVVSLARIAEEEEEEEE